MTSRENAICFVVGKRPYMCAECGETFVYRTCLREHKKRHSDVREYACETCGKAFKVTMTTVN